jgi:hypothetical protein
MRRTLASVVCSLLLGCGSHASSAEDAAVRDTSVSLPVDASVPVNVTLPPVNAGLDYQLGGAYALPDGVTVVSRDRNDPPAASAYNVCYVNGFQIQQEEEPEWMSAHPELILRDAGGDLVIDTGWDEWLIDIRTPEKRAAVAEIVGAWIEKCAADGFDAVEIDNLDSYSRSNGLLDPEDAIATMRLFADTAHAVNLAIAQKNSSELVPRRNDMATDFAVIEECNRWDECDAYTAGYGEHVLIIEYRMQDFTKGCAAYPGLSIVYRDVKLRMPGDTSYRYQGC